MSEGDPLEPDARAQAVQPAAPAPARYYPLPPAPAAEMKPISKWVWIGCAILVLALCGATVPIYRSLVRQWHKADPLIAGLHQKMVKGDDAGIFADSDPLYQEQVGREKSDKLFDYVRSELGAPQSSSLESQNISTDVTAGTVLTVTFDTDFEKGTGTETLKLHKVNGVYRMLGYKVLSAQIKNDAVPADIKLQQ